MSAPTLVRSHVEISRSADRRFTDRKVWNACNACKQGRRKCDGAAKCDGCWTRGLHCVYTENKPRGRPLKIKDVSLSQYYADFAPPDPCLSVGRAGASCGPELRPLTLEERGRMVVILRYTNRISKVVDSMHFFSALDAAIADDSSSLAPVSPATAGLRACFFALLCASSRFRTDDAGEEAHYRNALTCVDASLSERPDAHLVSALLILTIAQFFRVCGDSGDAGALATLAESICSTAPHLYDPGIAVTATCFAKKTATIRYKCGTVWPSLTAPINSVPSARAIELISFATLQFNGFLHIESEHVKPFFSLLDEAITLESLLGPQTATPIAPVALATKSLLSLREGYAEDAIVFALRAFDALWDIHVLNLAAMYVISQLLLAVPVMCESIRVYDSPSVDVLKGEVCAAATPPPFSAALRLLMTPGGAFSTGPIAKYFLPTVDALTTPRIPDGMPSTVAVVVSSAVSGAPDCSATPPRQNGLAAHCPFTNPPPSALQFLPRHPEPASKAAYILQALLQQYPCETVPLVNPTPPGGFSDLIGAQS